MNSDESNSGNASLSEVLVGESLILGLLGKLLYNYPERAWIQSLADEELFAESPFGSEQPDITAGLTLLQGWTRTSRGGMTDEAFDDLRADYTRLFIGPNSVLAPPWESVHLSVDQLLFQEQTLQVRAWYQRFGLEAPNLHAEPDDHVGLELSFAGQLAKLASEREDRAASEQLLGAQRDFLSQHVLKWVPAWCGQVESQARTEFYRGIALLTRGALREAAVILGIGTLS
jgi:putative dimethyl sulfoxide reductase chaperone